MQSPHTTTPASFHQFLGQQVASVEGTQMTPEQALGLWREREATLAAIREGLSDVDAGRVRPADEVVAELRAESNEA